MNLGRLIVLDFLITFYLDIYDHFFVCKIIISIISLMYILYLYLNNFDNIDINIDLCLTRDNKGPNI